MRGWTLPQIFLADGTLSIEVFPDKSASDVTGFGANKRSYHR